MKLNAKSDKAKELLPDLLEHQGRLLATLEQVEEILAAFNRAWHGDLKESAPHQVDDARPEEVPPMPIVQGIYKGMGLLEDQGQNLLKQVVEIRNLYLGDRL